MTDRSRAPMPRDVHTRERVRDAQAAEAAAVTAVCTAQAALARQIGRRDRAIAAADATVHAAVSALADRQAGVVKVSGLERAALLLGVSKAELRRAIAHAGNEAGASA